MVSNITREDFKLIIASLNAAYPKDDFMPNQHTFSLWYSMLQDIDYQTLNRAAAAYISQNHFPPSISDIRQLAHDLTAPPDDIAAEEWEKLMKALGNAGRIDAFDYWQQLPESTKQIVGGFCQFKEWAFMPKEDLMNVQRPMFIKRFEDMAKRNRTAGALPDWARTPTKSLEGYTPPALEDKSSSEAREKTKAPAELLARLRQRLNAASVASSPGTGK